MTSVSAPIAGGPVLGPSENCGRLVHHSGNRLQQLDLAAELLLAVGQLANLPGHLLHAVLQAVLRVRQFVGPLPVLVSCQGRSRLLGHASLFTQIDFPLQDL